jgi:hypothetical protein
MESTPQTRRITRPAMTTPAHTPGPWWQRRTGQHEPVVYAADVDRLKRDASALLAACEAALAEFDKCTMFDANGSKFDDLRAAIAKAKGGS